MEVEEVRVCRSGLGTSMSFVVVLMIREPARARRYHAGEKRRSGASPVSLIPPSSTTKTTNFPPFSLSTLHRLSSFLPTVNFHLEPRRLTCYILS